MRGNHHARCEPGEKVEITSKPYLSVYKLNIAPATGDDDNWVQKEIGNLLEDLVAKIFHVKTGYKPYQIKKMFRHPKYPFMIADVDYFADISDKTTVILEIKTTNYNNKDKWRDGKTEIIPLHYELQGRHYMAVMNLDRVYYCCLYGNTEDEVIIRRIDRDLEYESELIALEEYFWETHVLAKKPPPYRENGDLVLESVLRHHGNADASAPEIMLGENNKANILRLLELQETKKEYDSHVKALESNIKRIRGQIIDDMGRSCSASCEVEGIPYVVTYNPVLTPAIDKDNLKRLKDRYPEIYDEFVTVSEQRRFYLKKKEKEKDSA